MADNENIPVIDFTISPGSTHGAPVDPTLSIEGMAADAKATGDAIAAVDDRIGGQLPAGYSDVADAITKLTENTASVVRSVNGAGPDAEGDVVVRRVDIAGNLEADDMQESRETFTQRTAGGGASIADGDADLVSVYGRSVRTGAVEEVLTVTVTMVEGQSRPDQLTATIDRETFIARASGSETITLTYSGTAWNQDPALYGVTVSGTPFAGDIITIVYVAEDLGLFVNAAPESFVATGWNLYNHAEGYARVAAYGGSYRIDGSYTTVRFSETEEGAKTAVTVTDRLFSVNKDGYIWVTGGNDSDTAVYPVWTDWAGGTDEAFAAYREDVIDLDTAMTAAFPYGMCAVGLVRDELRVDVGRAISWIDRMENTAENLAAAQATGRDYQVDRSWIYIVRAAPVVTEVEIESGFVASDHGMEWFTGSEIDVPAYLLYGRNLKDKLRSDVLTISSQTLTSGQQLQARTNIGAAADAELQLVEGRVDAVEDDVEDLQTDVGGLQTSVGGLQTDVGTIQGDVTGLQTDVGDLQDDVGDLGDSLGKTQEGIAIVATGDTHAAVASGQYVYVRGHSTLAEGLYKATAAIAANAALTTSNLTAVSGGLGSEVASLTSKLAKFKIHTQTVTTNQNGAANINLESSKIVIGGKLDKNGHFRMDIYNGYWYIADCDASTTYVVTVMYYDE